MAIKTLKFRLKAGDNLVNVPGRPLGGGHLGYQDGEPTWWVAVDGSRAPMTVHLYTVVTGQDLPDDVDPEYLGTAQHPDVNFVLHLYRLD